MTDDDWFEESMIAYAEDGAISNMEDWCTLWLERHGSRRSGSPMHDQDPPTYNGEPCLLTSAQRADFIRACDGTVSIELARENGFFHGC